MSSTVHPAGRPGDRSLTRSLLVMVAGSFAFGFLLVPLYDVICEAAGIRVNDTPSAIQASSAGVGREVTLEFMSMIPDGSAFELTPETRSMKLQPGKLYEARFLVRSRADVPVVAQAIPSVAPSTSCKVPAEDRVLLLYAADLRRGRAAGVHGALHRVPRPAAGSGPHDAGLFDVHGAARLTVPGFT